MAAPPAATGVPGRDHRRFRPARAGKTQVALWRLRGTVSEAVEPALTAISDTGEKVDR